MKLAQSGAHPGQNGLIPRLRNLFFIKNSEKIVAEYVNSFSYCQMFTNKVYRHPVKPNKVPERCWEKLLPSKNHIVVIQDLAFRYRIAKLIKSTGEKPVIPILEDVYDTFGNPIRQKSDNGAPFNSKEIGKFTKK